MSSQKRTNSRSDSEKSHKRLKEDEPSSSSDSGESDSSDEQMEVDQVQIDFSGFELAPEDHNGVRLLLQQLFLKSEIDLTEMTHHLIEQQLNVGSVIKETEIDETPSTDANEDDTVYGLIDVVSLKPNKELKFVAQLRAMFLELSKQHATEQTKNFVDSLFADAKNIVGLILNERYLNLPPSISEPSFTKLISEIEAESKEDPRFSFTHYILIAKLYKIPSKKKHAGDQEVQTIWSNAEEELFDKLADARFEYPVENDCDSGLSGKWTEDDEQVLPFRRVLVFKANKLTDLVAELSNCV